MRKRCKYCSKRTAAVLLAVLLLCGCAQEKELASVEITELRVVYSSGDANWKSCLETVAEQFMEENPEIQIELYTPGNQENRLYSDQLKILYAEDQFYDVLELREPQKVADAGLLADMPDSVTKLIDPEALGRENSQYIPIYQMDRGIICNMDIFEDLGLSVPETYEKFLSCCETIKEAGYTPVVIGGADLWHMEFWGNYLFENFMLDEDQEIVWTYDRAEKMLRSFRELSEKGYVGNEYRELSDNETVQEIATGNAVMLHTGAWMLPQIGGMNPEMELGFFFLSGQEGTTYAVQDLSNCWGISRECQSDPDKYEAASEFLEFFYSEEVYENVLGTMSAASVTRREAKTAESDTDKLVDSAYEKDVTVTNKIVSNLDTPDGFRNSFNQILRETLWGTTSVEVLAAELTEDWEAER